MNSKLIIRVLLCSTFIAGSAAILQSCVFDPGAKTLFASEEPNRNTPNAMPARKTTPTVKKVVAKSNETAFGRSGNDSGSNSGSNSGSSSGGMGGGSSGGQSW
ncbi:conserved hypothetical protein (plasmid) [Rhizobium leguminosarum bv. trifolii WSM2304]|uniref:Lipoprotein n=1 Tax=Rhizobium leguminosarum bv. trifolii (strain WSM2304) TaxID=395492 RepID=A0ABF7QYA2_RHILW|nr:hypothetical protein [Rhizobium leguminosarum]ACI59216.1 conserved hypothetical protein [Rhizobium leguminosarum bv. trifolii WSM2304]